MALPEAGIWTQASGCIEHRGDFTIVVNHQQIRVGLGLYLSGEEKTVHAHKQSVLLPVRAAAALHEGRHWHRRLARGTRNGKVCLKG